MLDFNAWDWCLMAVVTVMSSLLAWFRSPAWKAFVLGLPLPFTCVTLSLGGGVEAGHAAGLGVLLLYTHGVRILAQGRRVPTAVAIALCALGYSVAAGILNRLLPRTDAAFWAAAVAMALAGAVAFRFSPAPPEPGHRTALPFWIKVPIVALVVVFLVAIKNQIGGFMATFPMVGVIGAYEARHSLRAICRQIAWVVFGMAVMMMVVRVVHHGFTAQLGAGVALGAGLAAGWAVYLGLLAAATRGRWVFVAAPAADGKEAHG